MDGFEPKKLLILRIYQILNEYSDADHKLKQADIIAYLASEYGIECERKAIARNIDYLKHAGIDIVQDRGDGYYLAERRFEHGELRFLTDSVIANRNVCESYTKEIIRKLVKEGGVYYKNYARCVDLGDWRKNENKEYFLNIELLSEAIEKKVKVTFRFMHYGVDKRLHARKPDKETVNPYKLFFKNGHYYLACNVDKYDQLIFCRIDKIADIEVTNIPAKDGAVVKGAERGINLGIISNSAPYLFVERPLKIVFEAATDDVVNMIDYVLDQFGDDVGIRTTRTGRTVFTVMASPKAMKIWLLQFGASVKVLSPASLVKSIKEETQKMNALYE